MYPESEYQINGLLAYSSMVVVVVVVVIIRRRLYFGGIVVECDILFMMEQYCHQNYVHYYHYQQYLPMLLYIVSLPVSSTVVMTHSFLTGCDCCWYHHRLTFRSLYYFYIFFVIPTVSIIVMVQYVSNGTVQYCDPIQSSY